MDLEIRPVYYIEKKEKNQVFSGFSFGWLDTRRLDFYFLFSCLFFFYYLCVAVDELVGC